MEEIWKVCSQFPDYEVSNTGNIRKRGFKKVYDTGVEEDVPPQDVSIHKTSGYKYIRIDGKIQKLHRLIAATFLDNPENLKLVKHKDGNKDNNSVSNLEWTRPAPNITDYKFSGNRVRCLEDNLEFDSIQEAAKHYNVSYDKLWYLVKHNKSFDDKTIVEIQ